MIGAADRALADAVADRPGGTPFRRCATGCGAVYPGLDWNSLSPVLFIAGVPGFAVATVALVMAAWRQPTAAR